MFGASEKTIGRFGEQVPRDKRRTLRLAHHRLKHQRPYRENRYKDNHIIVQHQRPHRQSRESIEEQLDIERTDCSNYTAFCSSATASGIAAAGRLLQLSFGRSSSSCQTSQQVFVLLCHLRDVSFL